MSALELKTATGEDAVGKALEIPAGGLALTLRVPAVDRAHLELTGVELELVAPGGKEGVEVPDLAVTTNLGALGLQKDKDLTWLAVDWGEPRTVVGLEATVDTNATSTLMRLKVSDGGMWFPPLQAQTVKLGGGQSLPDLVASRLMLEPVEDKSGALVPSSTRLSTLEVRLARQPSDLALRVGRKAPCYERRGRLPPGQSVLITRELHEALARELPGDGTAADIPLRLEAGIRGRVKLESARFTTSTVFTRLDAGEPLLPLSWHEDAVGRVTVGTGATLEEVRFTLVPELATERILLEPGPEEDSRLAWLCAPGHSAAQGFPALGPRPLAGVDVRLRTSRSPVRGTLALHPDAGGRPGPQPYPGTSVDFRVEETGPEPWPSRLVPLQLPKPLRLEAPWWLVLAVSEGEAFWPLGASAPALQEGSLLPTLHRLGEGVWYPWEPPSGALWASCRLRLAERPSSVSFEVGLRRGTRRQRVADVKGEGPGVASTEVLRLLDESRAEVGGEVLEVVVRPVGEPVSGAVRLSGLRVAIRDASR
jgi:hypothetical protein